MALKDKNISPDLEPDREIEAAIRPLLEDGLLTCQAAITAAKELGCEPIAVGRTADALNIHLSSCQLGLFGYPGHTKGWGPAGVAELAIPAGLEETLLDERDPQGNISCRELWRQAERFAISRMQMGYVVDRFAVKVRPCKLGAF